MTRSTLSSILGAAAASVVLSFAPSASSAAQPSDRIGAISPEKGVYTGSDDGTAPPAPVTRAVGSVDIPLAGWQTFNDQFPGALNTQTTVNLPASAQITNAEWIDLSFTTENGSWMSEFTLSLNQSTNTGLAGTFWDMRPGGAPATGFGVGGTYGPLSGVFTSPSNQFSSNPFPLLPDGQLLVYVYESFNDALDARDALVSQGTLRVTYTYTDIPEPASIGALAAGGLFLIRRRRTQA